MYKKAFLVLLMGISVFYTIALLKMLVSQQTHPVSINTPVVVPPIKDPVPTFTPPPPVPGVRPRIDVVFAIDSTGSMQDEIDVVKDNIRNIISEISQGQPSPDVRYGIVTYRDRGDEYVTRSWAFTRDIQEISTALASIVAAGGGDKPESVNEALHVTLHNMAWDAQANSKLVFLIGDAGPHFYQNDYKWQDEVVYAQKQGISINTIACSGIEPNEEQVFNMISTQSNGNYAHLTYKQEYAKSDGSHTTIIEEAGKTYAVDDVADKDWSRGASELVARNAAKEITAPPASYSSGVSSYGSSGVESAVRNIEGGVVGGVVGSVGGAPAAEPIDEIAMNRADAASSARLESKSLAKDSRAGGAPAAPAIAYRDSRMDAPAKNSSMGVSSTMSVAAKPSAMGEMAVGAKTNNLNTVLADSIKKAARQQGTTYGKVISPLFDFKGKASGVKKANSLLIDNKAQLKSLLSGASDIDINRIDFNNQVVIAVFMGETDDKAEVTISKISLSGNDLLVSLNRSASASGKATPFHLVVLPKTWEGKQLNAKDIFVRFD